MNKQEFKALAIALGWVEDKYGHLKSPSGNSRIKFQDRSLRLEKKYQPSESYGYKPPAQWLNVVSDYYVNITLTPDNRPVIKGKPLIKLEPINLKPLPGTTFYKGKAGYFYRPTPALLRELLENSDGFCTACGHIEPTEPDTDKVACPSCGKPLFRGAEALALRFM